LQVANHINPCVSHGSSFSGSVSKKWSATISALIAFRAHHRRMLAMASSAAASGGSVSSDCSWLGLARTASISGMLRARNERGRQLEAALLETQFLNCLCGNLRRVFQTGFADFYYLLGYQFG